MNPKIRKSVAEDAKHFMAIKNQLSLNNATDTTMDGGFILGTDLNTYQFYVENGICLTATNNNKIVGYGIVLPFTLVKQSELWLKRKSVQWDIELEEIETKNIAYFEQLAFLKGNRKLSMLLAYKISKTAFDDGADYILTTTVKEPILNLAAVPYIKGVGGKLVGRIDEVYPNYSNIISDIYLISKSDFISRTSSFLIIVF